jgi:ELWxxDGT repeat protein
MKRVFLSIALVISIIGNSQEFNLLKDFTPGPNTGGTIPITGLNGIGIFIADDHINGYEIWKSDGTPAGTILVKDINPGAGHGTSYNATNSPMAVNGVVFFVGNNGVDGLELWKTDGTSAGTVMVKDIRAGSTSSNPDAFLNLNGTLYFTANDGVNGWDLWKSDGTEAGTTIVKQLSTTPAANLADISGTLFFTTGSGASGHDLWKSDGTEAGTIALKHIAVFQDNTPTPRSFINVNGSLFFVAKDDEGWELWKSDGTATGTTMVKNINAGDESSLPENLANLNGILYFSANDGVNGNELWKSDGTEAGTIMLKDIYTGAQNSSSPSYLVNFNGILYFTAVELASGRELWKTDGTVAGTEMVMDILPGQGNGCGLNLTITGGRLLFPANDGINGEEIWRSNGLVSGTVMMDDINTGNAGSMPKGIIDVGGTIFLTATTDDFGTELYASTIEEGPLPLTWVAFTGRKHNTDAILNWKTENEINTDKFFVERSLNGSDYLDIGIVYAAGNAGTRQYSFTDPNITSLGKDVVYYRLRQKDMDARVTYSRIVALPVDGRTMLMFYPNPVLQEANLVISVDKPEQVQYSIIDNLGRIVKQQQWKLAAGSTSLSIDMSTIPKGVYHLVLTGQQVDLRKKFVKQ